MKNFVTIIVVAAIVFQSFAFTNAVTTDAKPIPENYSDLCSVLDKKLTENEKLIKQSNVVWGGTGVELVAANANKGTDLLKADTLKSIYKNLDVLKKMGTTGVTINIAFPLLRPNTPRQKEYIAFYKKLAQYIKNLKMTLMVKVHNIFPDQVYGNPSMKIKGMKYDDYLKQKKAQILLVAQELKPNFLTLDNEPTTQKFITGFNFTPDLWKSTTAYFLKDFKHDGIKVGCGAGSWDDFKYFQGLCDLPLDFIDIHIYPVTGDFLYKNVDKICKLVQSKNKEVVIGEAWLYKTDVYNNSDFETNYIKTFLRDSYSFWEPLDCRFIKAVSGVARMEKVVYTSFFWSNYFFAYIDYDPSYETMDPKDVLKKESKAATTNMFSNPYKTTKTGSTYADLQKSNATADITVMIAEGGGRVSYCPKNGLIAYDFIGKDGYFDVWTMKADGSDKKNLTHSFRELSKHCGNPCWDPSGKFIVFQAQDPNVSMKNQELAMPGIGINNNIYVISADGKKTWKMSKVRSGGGSLHPQFSPDGKSLVWSNIIPSTETIGRSEIMLFKISLTDQPKLLELDTLNPGYLGLYETHGFSPDGSKLIFSGIPSGKGYYDMEIYTCSVDGSNLKKLTSNTDWDEHAHYSPDCKNIVWMTSTGTNCPKQTATLQSDFWAMKADGSGKRRISFINDSTKPQFMGKVIAADFDWIDADTIIAKLGVVKDKSKLEMIVRINLKI